MNSRERQAEINAFLMGMPLRSIEAAKLLPKGHPLRTYAIMRTVNPKTKMETDDIRFFEGTLESVGDSYIEVRENETHKLHRKRYTEVARKQMYSKYFVGEAKRALALVSIECGPESARRCLEATVVRDVRDLVPQDCDALIEACERALGYTLPREDDLGSVPSCPRRHTNDCRECRTRSVILSGCKFAESRCQKAPAA